MPPPTDIMPIVDFFEELFLPFTPDPIPLDPIWKRLLIATLTPCADGTIPYQNILLSLVKKAGKSSLAAGIGIWWALFIAPDGKDVVSVANKREQAKGRAFRTMKAAFEAHPALRSACTFIGENLIETNRGVRCYPVTSDGSGEAGLEPTLVIADEIWGLTEERAEELWTELTPVPTLAGRSARLITSYAGWKDRSRILWRVYEQWRAGEPVPGFEDMLNNLGEPVMRCNRRAGLIGCWDTERRMSWQRGPAADAYYEQERAMKSRSEFDRVHANLWAEAQEGLDMDEWRACEDAEYRIPTPSQNIYLAVGADASTHRDFTAVVSLYLKDGMYCLGPWRIYKPERGVDFDLDATVNAFVRWLASNYSVREVFYDEYQLHQIGLQWRADGLVAQPLKQTIPNCRLMGTLLTQGLRDRQFRLTVNKELREQAEQTSVKAVPDGVLLKKDSQRKKIDAIIALAMARVAASNLPESGESSGAVIEVLG